MKRHDAEEERKKKRREIARKSILTPQALAKLRLPKSEQHKKRIAEGVRKARAKQKKPKPK
jgi:hypothetical protein